MQNAFPRLARQEFRRNARSVALNWKRRKASSTGIYGNVLPAVFEEDGILSTPRQFGQRRSGGGKPKPSQVLHRSHLLIRRRAKRITDPVSLTIPVPTFLLLLKLSHRLRQAGHNTDSGDGQGHEDRIHHFLFVAPAAFAIGTCTLTAISSPIEAFMAI